MRYTAGLNVKVTPETKKKFVRRAKMFGDPSKVMRELIEAFAEDRVKIAAPSTEGTIYDVPTTKE